MTKLSKRFKKRHILFALMGLEIVSLPVSAHIVTSFEMPESRIISSAQFPQAEKGEARFFVSANAPFAVVADSKFATYNVDITVAGEMGQQEFGSNAQLPGMPKTCSQVRTDGPAVIYKANRGTQAAEGSATSRAVLVTVTYPKNLSPEFKIVDLQDTGKINNSRTCTNA